MTAAHPVGAGTTGTTPAPSARPQSGRRPASTPTIHDLQPPLLLSGKARRLQDRSIMTATTAERAVVLRDAADVLRKLDDISDADTFGSSVRVLEDFADELETSRDDDDLGPARLREIQEHIQAGLA